MQANHVWPIILAWEGIHYMNGCRCDLRRCSDLNCQYVWMPESRSTKRLGYCLTGHQRIEFGPCNDNRGQSEKKTHQIRITNAREGAGNNGSIRIWMCGWLADSPDSQLKSTSIRLADNKKHQKSRRTSRMQTHGLLFIESRSFPLPVTTTMRIIVPSYVTPSAMGADMRSIYIGTFNNRHRVCAIQPCDYFQGCDLVMGGNPTIIQPRLGQAKIGQSDSKKGVIRYISASSKCHGATHTNNGPIRSYSIYAEPLRRWFDKNLSWGFLVTAWCAWPGQGLISISPLNTVTLFLLLMQRLISTNAVFFWSTSVALIWRWESSVELGLTTRPKFNQALKALTRHTISIKMKWINPGWIRPVLLCLFRNPQL